MRKTILTTSLLVILTLSLTQLATAQWKNNVFKNETSGDVFVAFTTYRPATGNVPLGWRTVAWYRVKAGQSHTFNAFDDNPIYYLIIDQATGRRLLPDNAKAYTGWMYNKAFVIVSRNEPNTLTPAGDLLFTTHARTSNLLLEDSNFFKSANTGSVTVTPAGVIAPRAEPSDETVDLPTGINISTASGSTTLNQGSTTQLTISVKENGDPLANQLVFITTHPQTIATLAPNNGQTDDEGKFKTSLNVDVDAPTGNFEVHAQLAGTSKLGKQLFTIAGPSSLDISLARSTIEPEEDVGVNFTVKTQSGAPYKNADISLSASSGKINPARVKTDSNGQATATFTAPYSGDPAAVGPPIEMPKITATVLDSNGDPSSVTKTADVTVQYLPRSVSISRSASTIEPGKTSKLTITVRGRSNPLSNADISLSASSGRINPARMKTDSNGQVIATFTAKSFSGTPRLSTIETPKITATVLNSGGLNAIENSTTITVKYIPGTITISGVPSNEDVTSGNTLSITAKVLSSVSRSPMSGVTVNFQENSSYLRFSSTRVTTGSNGTATSTLRTGGAGEDREITVTVSGYPNVSDTARVDVKPDSHYYDSNKVSFRSREVGFFDSANWYWTNWKTVTVSNACYSVRSWSGHADVSVVDDAFVDEEDIKNENSNAVKKTGSRTWQIRVRIREHTVNANEVTAWVRAHCDTVASNPGAPSLQPQLRPETRPLSEIWQELSQVPLETVLLANYPNPFNPETWIPYHLAEPAEVTLTIYAADGKLVRTLALGHQAAGIYENKSRAAYWDGRNSVGERVASGLYFYTLTAGDFAATGKMLIMK